MSFDKLRSPVRGTEQAVVLKALVATYTKAAEDVKRYLTGLRQLRTEAAR